MNQNINISILNYIGILAGKISLLKIIYHKIPVFQLYSDNKYILSQYEKYGNWQQQKKYFFKVKMLVKILHIFADFSNKALFGKEICCIINKNHQDIQINEGKWSDEYRSY